MVTNRTRGETGRDSPQIFADNLTFHEAGGPDNPHAGTYVGKAETLAFLGRMADLTEGSSKFELVELYEDDDRVVAVQHTTAKRPDGRTYDSREAVIFELRNGLVVSVYTLVSELAKFVDFWRE